MRGQKLIARAIHAAQYAALRGSFSLLHSFDVNQNMRTAAGVGSLFFRLSPRHRERTRSNIARSFPQMSLEEADALAERSIQSMFQLFMVESMATPRLIGPSTWSRHVELGDISQASEVALADKPVIFVTGHCGNWEALGFTMSVIGFPMTALARPLDNPWLDEWIVRTREARGLKVLTKWGATSEVQRIIEARGRVAFIADQNAGDDGLFVPFFGRLASSYKSIGLLAMRYEVPIVVGLAQRLCGQFRYRVSCVDVIKPQDWVDQADPLFYITARYNRGIETAVRQAPEQYLWIHRRWKSRPPWERKGEPLPARFRHRLETLPWMTQADVNACCIPVKTPPS
ncbi:MAG: hypothetical protein EXS00_07750 [Phycisphaerales bacterium]|nr:hypothetical protein [Phycisphaerales bacterium]